MTVQPVTSYVAEARPLPRCALPSCDRALHRANARYCSPAHRTAHWKLRHGPKAERDRARRRAERQAGGGPSDKRLQYSRALAEVERLLREDLNCDVVSAHRMARAALDRALPGRRG
jgi:hypothetical protein